MRLRAMQRALLAASLCALALTSAPQRLRKHAGSIRTRGRASSRSTWRARPPRCGSNSAPTSTASTSTSTISATTGTARSRSRSSGRRRSSRRSSRRLRHHRRSRATPRGGLSHGRTRSDDQGRERAPTSRRARSAARCCTHSDEIVVLRVDYFENYAGRFLSVEARPPRRLDGDRRELHRPDRLAVVELRAGHADQLAARTMDVNIDPDTTPDTYIEHRELFDRRGRRRHAGTRPRGSASGRAQARRSRPTSTSGSAAVCRRWRRGHLTDFTTHYLDPTEVYARFDQLAAEFSNIAELIPPYTTNGYQRRAHGQHGRARSRSGTRQSGAAGQARPSSSSRAPGATRAGTTSRAEFRNPEPWLWPSPSAWRSRRGNDIIVEPRRRTPPANPTARPHRSSPRSTPVPRRARSLGR